MVTIKSYTDLQQSKKLAEILPLYSADMCYLSEESLVPKVIYNGMAFFDSKEERLTNIIHCWSLAALLKLIPKHILRKDKIHCGQAFIPSFRWEISPTAIYYTDGNNIMDYVSFRYGENNIELIDAVFRMVVWLKKNNRL